VSESVSIRERVLRQLAANLEAVTDVGEVRRWDARAADTPAHGDIVLVAQDETAEPGAQGPTGSTIKTLTVAIVVRLFAETASETTTDSDVNKWLRRIEDAALHDPLLVETTSGQRLANDMAATKLIGPAFDEGIVACALVCTIQYEHDRDDPTVGPGITLLQE